MKGAIKLIWLCSWLLTLSAVKTVAGQQQRATWWSTHKIPTNAFSWFTFLLHFLHGYVQSGLFTLKMKHNKTNIIFSHQFKANHRYHWLDSSDSTLPTDDANASWATSPGHVTLIMVSVVFNTERGSGSCPAPSRYFMFYLISSQTGSKGKMRFKTALY